MHLLVPSASRIISVITNGFKAAMTVLNRAAEKLVGCLRSKHACGTKITT
jgi:hypothetical protein